MLTKRKGEDLPFLFFDAGKDSKRIEGPEFRKA